MALPTYDYALAGVCEKIIRQTSAMVGRNYAFNLGRKTGALDFILSPDNGGIKASYTQDGSKVIRAKVLYKQRSLPCEIQDGADALDASVCDTALEPVEKSADLTVADGLSTYPKKFTNGNLVQICQNTDQWVMEYLMSDLRAMREKLSMKVLAKMAVNAGVTLRQDGSTTASNTYTNVPIMQTTNGIKVPLTANFNDVLMDYQNMQFSGTPVFIGQGNLHTAFQLMKYACCNAVTPYADALSQSGSAYYYDQGANATLGLPTDSRYTRALMVTYGASHLLWFNVNTNIMIDNDLVKAITIQDPVYPQLKWDMDMKFDICTKTWVYAYSARFDVYNAFKSDAFKTDNPSPACDDELFGVTGIWKYQFGNV